MASRCRATRNDWKRFARALGLRPLGDYLCYPPKDARAMMGDLAASTDEIDRAEFPPLRGYDAREGHGRVTKIAVHAQATPSTVKNAKGVLPDLDEDWAILFKARTDARALAEPAS
jgi:hypothetical protein